ncbi:MAG TPA: hypothetical protein VF789_34150 [Thermoanaerobaculia bacterium]
MTRRHPLPPSPLSWRRSLLALLAGIALAFGAVAPHDQALEGTGRSLTPTAVAETARHPGDPAHFEASSPLEIHHACVACLLQIQSRGQMAGLPVSTLPSLTWNAGIGVLTEQPASPGPRRTGPPRAPPSLSPVA